MDKNNEEFANILKGIATGINTIFTDAIKELTSKDTTETPETKLRADADALRPVPATNIRDEDDDDDYLDPYDDYYGDDDDEDYEPYVAPAVKYDVQENGEVVEVTEGGENSDALFDRANQSVEHAREIEAEFVEEGYEQVHGDHLELTFTLLNEDEEPEGSLSVTDVRRIFDNPFTTASLSNFGNTRLVRITPGANDASKVATLAVMQGGRASLEALSRGLFAYRGERPFPGVGVVRLEGRAVLVD